MDILKTKEPTFGYRKSFSLDPHISNLKICPPPGILVQSPGLVVLGQTPLSFSWITVHPGLGLEVFLTLPALLLPSRGDPFKSLVGWDLALSRSGSSVNSLEKEEALFQVIGWTRWANWGGEAWGMCYIPDKNAFWKNWKVWKILRKVMRRPKYHWKK